MTHFADTIRQQQIFRALLAAQSYPGRVHTVASDAGVADVVVTLVDRQVTLADPHHHLPESLWPWLGMTASSTTEAQYVVSPGDHCPDYKPRIGTLSSPEGGATIIIPVRSLTQLSRLEAASASSASETLVVSGPSKKSPKRRALVVEGLHRDWPAIRGMWHEGFPLGTDWLLVAPDDQGSTISIAAIPRSCELGSPAAFTPSLERLDP